MTSPRDPSLAALAASLARRYDLGAEIGRGGMATVYLARDLRHDREVAIKVLHASIATALGPERFLREVRIAAQLHHPHILPVFDSGDADGVLWYAMPFVEGESLRDRLRAAGALPLEESVNLIREVADALAKAHRGGIVHRDIKPENILLADGHALVADFGVAKAIGTDGPVGTGLTTAGTSLGTPAYMAPEQVAADPAADHRVDLYALGIVGYEMLVGRTPFADLPPAQQLAAHVTTVPDDITIHRPDCPRAVADVIARCLAKIPADRPATGDEIRALLGSEGISGPITGNRVAFAARRRWLLPAGILAVVAVAVAALWPRSTTTGRPGQRSLAVLPFVNLSGDTASDYFSDGVSEEILGAVSRLEGMRVVGRSVSFQYRGRDVDARKVGRDLGVAHVLEGSVQRVGGQVRVNVQLTDAKNGINAWSARYDRDLTDIFAVEDEIARAVAAALDVELALPASGRVANVAAHDHYLLGLAAINRRDIPGAARHFRAAVEEDSSYAEAVGGLAVAQALVPEWTSARADSVIPIARALAERAIALDSTEARGWEALGYVRLTYDWDVGGAETTFRRAIRHDPNAVSAWQWLGLTMVAMRRAADAREAFRRALALDPSSAAIHANYAIALEAGRWPDPRSGRDSAIAQLRTSLVLPSGNERFLYQYYLAHLLVLRRDLGLAEEGLRKAGQLLGDGEVYLPLVRGLADSTRRDAALRTLHTWANDPAAPLPLVFVAGWYTILGAKDRAVALLDAGVTRRAPFMTYLDGVGFEGLDGNAGYMEVRRRIGLPGQRE